MVLGGGVDRMIYYLIVWESIIWKIVIFDF